MNIRFVFGLGSLILLLMASCTSMTERYEITSPDGDIKAFFLLDDGKPFYEVTFNDSIVIERSEMGFELADGPSLNGNFMIDEVMISSENRRWEPAWGESSSFRERYNRNYFSLKEKGEPGRKLDIEFRVFDDGLGFRYVFPEDSGLDTLLIQDELTRFRFNDDHSAWWTPGDYNSYEHLYRNTPVSGIDSANTPVTIELHDSLYISLHEANLTDFAGMTLKRDEEGTATLKSQLVPWPDGIGVKAGIPHQSPWRTIQVAETPGSLIESGLILNLNEPCDWEDVSWIKPMKYIGIWWGMHIDKYTWHSGPRHGATTERTIKYIDFAGENDIPGVLVEGWNKGWESWLEANSFDFITPYEDFDLEKVAAYAKEKGVYLIGHHETGANVPVYEKYIDEAMDLYRDLGIRAIKTGYAGKMKPEGYYHHGQWMVNHYRMVVEKAAARKIMIDAHEPIKPTGTRRTYPNMMTREGVRGQEYNAWSEGNPPDHTTILPFTRMLAGPLDYTPGIFEVLFNDYKEKERVQSTVAKELALFVVLYSPLQMAADLPENYEGNPAFQFIKDVPVDWDETRVLNGKIGDYVTIARRADDEWYIGSITDENSRNFEFSLDFLKDDTDYKVTVYADGPSADWETEPYDVEIRELKVTSADTLEVRLAKGGGQAIRIVPAK